ncbi:MAG: hypothetical protein JXR27_05795 [Paludibacteraceae bacterium]|nr:hypothetical protein [Paludibacteraceae bacterium]
MDYAKRFYELNSVFQLGRNIDLPDSDCCIQFFCFDSKGLWPTHKIVADEPVFCDTVTENSSFLYPVFIPKKKYNSENAILLLHGLNERNWSKYLTWAEYLCQKTGKAVILFPIAFHINRSPQHWSNPRMLQAVYDLRRKRNGDDRMLSFANVALSERISENPYRFYSSGRQSLSDIENLVFSIKNGQHSLFQENTQIDVFSYSIGAFLSQIAFLTNNGGLFNDARLFMFCGGSIFSEMFGQSRTIMDSKAFARLYNYYKYEFSTTDESISQNDKILQSFWSMISPERNEMRRTSFFESMGDRLSGISLNNDKVIPYKGVEQALGSELAHKRIDLLDFEIAYTHENPFPITKGDTKTLNFAFESVFSQAADFLG